MKKMAEEFQCPGCINGSDTECGRYNYDRNHLKCISHVLGTFFGLNNYFALGLPKGFNKPGRNEDGKVYLKMAIRLFKKGECPDWDKLNIPVWAMEKDGYLFVRTYLPRINYGFVDVIEGGTLKLVPNAINVSEFIHEID